ncbi:protein phosphatase 2C domain-containing protein [Nocardia aurantia]|uniref:PPM-type phosphatase domain-containing protein n=1 Tax=Nocardia aurantia TaxID=2585199 RepID=A0A7K0DJZ9_9NOCA|nr:protein phosphatase 2C domain-containing protein [Nocardia aurantia]MQY25988.1 hypothetical protein [Nocardia aurantia]
MSLFSKFRGPDDAAAGAAADPPPTAAQPAEPIALESNSYPVWPSDRPIVVGRPTPVFEPVAVGDEFRRVPYRPDTVLDGWSTGAFTVRAASMRGHLHRHNGAPRQDDLAITHALGHRLNVAVADGVSGAAQSHVGATTAVRYASQWLADSAPAGDSDIEWHTLFQYAAWALIEQTVTVLGLPEADAGLADQLLVTTLVVGACDALADGTVSARLAAVGDSAAWLLSGGQFIPLLGGKSASAAGLSSSAVDGLPRVPAEIATARAIVRPGDVLLMGTDGFGDPLGGGDGQVGDLFRGLLAGRVPSLVEFGHALDFSRETFDDDRTLVAIWPRPQQ